MTRGDIKSPFVVRESLASLEGLFLGSNGRMQAPPFGGQLSRMVSVSSKSDLPTPVAGVINLLANTCYYFTTSIDLTGDRLVGAPNTTLIGTSSEAVTISSTGLGATPLISSAYSMPIRFLSITATVALNLNATTSGQALDWLGVNFLNCPTVGSIQGYSNFIMTDSSLLNSGGMTFTGTIGTIGFISCLFDPPAGGTALIVDSAATITRRFRALACAFSVLAGETGIDFSTSATVPVEGFILGIVTFAGGGTYVSGVQHDDNKAQFFFVRGVANSASISSYGMQANATATVIGSAGVSVKVAGTTTSGTYIQRFTNTANRATYVGALDVFFEVRAIGTISAQNNREIAFRIAKNGTTIAESQMSTNSEGVTRSAPLMVQAVVDLSTNDFVEVFVANITDATNVTISDLSVVVNPLS